MEKQIAVLAGDGIGPEVMQESLRVLDAIADHFGHTFHYHEALVGGAAYDEYQEHLPQKTIELCRGAEAILFGSIGGPLRESHLPKWKDAEKNALLGIRKAFQFHANFRPATIYPELSDICPLKKEVISAGVDILIVRELLSGIYFGEHRTVVEAGKRYATDVCAYHEDEISRIAKTACEATMKRERKKLVSVDKANVLDTSKLWREVVQTVADDYPEIELEHMLVDNCAMQIIKHPGQFDVIVTSNMFGDILSDSAAVLPGSLGLTPSASLNSDGFGMYEPSGGSAPDIAGKGIANPIAQILSAAMMLQFSFDMTEEADAIRKGISLTLQRGIRTADIATENETAVSTKEMTDAIIAAIIG